MSSQVRSVRRGSVPRERWRVSSSISWTCTVLITRYPRIQTQSVTGLEFTILVYHATHAVSRDHVDCVRWAPDWTLQNTVRPCPRIATFPSPVVSAKFRGYHFSFLQETKAMDRPLGCASADRSFGPAIPSSCRGGFDFTLLFEQIFLSFFPAAALILASSFRLWQLQHTQTVTSGAVLQLSKQVGGIKLRIEEALLT